ncbi:MAG: ubiquitin-like domain-containing protein [Dehalococcoidia bacterium]|nr:ubiquitin-like domain-containing protein [Dehalococcoidia bacterium]
MTIEVAKAQAVTVTIDGTQGTMYTQAETVADGAWDALGIALGPDDARALRPRPRLATAVR